MCRRQVLSEPVVLQIHLSIAGPNAYWVMWATGENKVICMLLSHAAEALHCDKLQSTSEWECP